MEYPDQYRNAATQAILAQNASNLSGLIFTFAAVAEVLRERKRELGFGTEWFNKHPINYLFSVQIAYITGAGSIADGDYNRAYRICDMLSKGEIVEGY